jgi:MFS family permease
MLASANVGYSLTLPDPMLEKMKDQNIHPFLDGVFRSISSLVGVLGVYICWVFVRYRSYKVVMLIITAYDIFIWVIFWRSLEDQSFLVVIFVRALSGISIGGFCFIAPQYMNRLLIPIKYKPIFGMFSVYGIALGIFLGQFMAVWVNNAFLSFVGCGISLVMFILIAAFFDPETQEVATVEMKGEQIFQKKYAEKVGYIVLLMCFKQLSGVNTIIVNITNVLHYLNLPISLEMSSSIASSGLVVGAFSYPYLRKYFGRDIMWYMSIVMSVISLIMAAKDSPFVDYSPVSFGMILDIFLFFIFFTVGMWIITSEVVNDMFPSSMKESVVYVSALFNCFFVFAVKLFSSFFLNNEERSYMAFWIWVGGSCVQV